LNELEGLEALGNAGLVPAVIFLTQLIKSKIGKFKARSDMLALLLSFGLCIGWEFYYMTPEGYTALAARNGIELFHWGIDLVLVGFATWLASSKLYDLGHGNKKRNLTVSTTIAHHEAHAEALQKELVTLKNGQGENKHDAQTVEEINVANKLRSILEG